MADATQEKQVEQSEQLKELKTSLTAITQQLVISNSLDGDTKKEFQKANQGLLEAILQSNVLAETSEKGDLTGAKGDIKSEKAEGSRWKKLLGHFAWGKKFQERSTKLAKLAKEGVVKFGKTKLAKVTKFAGNMLDLLLKGLGLGILWGLFKWLEGKDWDEIVSKVKEWVEAIGLDWDATVATLKGIQTTLSEWGGLVGGIWTTVKAWKTIAWIANFGGSSLALMWAALKGIFGIAGSIAGLVKIVGGWALTTMWNITTGALGLLWKAIKLLFGSESMIGKMAISVGKWASAGLFGETGVLTKLWTNLKAFFGIGGKLSQTPGFLRTAEQMVDAKGIGLSKEGPLVRLWSWIKSFFGAESKLAGAWKAIKESKVVTTLFGEGSHLRNLMTWIGSFFGPESNIGKAATWIGGKVKLFKDYLTIGEAGKGGAISRLFSWVGGLFTGMKDGWAAVKNSKFFAGLKTVLGTGVKVGGGILKVVSKIFLPLTWIMGIGSAIWGFVKGFMGKEGVKDERTFATKITDGLKGAMKGLLDFFVIDLVVMVQDVMNWFVDKWNNSTMGSFKKFEKFTFGDDLANSVTDMMGISEESAANVKLGGEEVKKEGKAKILKEKEPINIDNILETAGGELEDKEGWGTGDKFKIGMDKFGSAIDKLDMAGLAQMAEKMEGMDKNKNIELLNSGGLKTRLQAEIKERMATLPAVEKAQQGGNGGTINAPMSVSKKVGTTTMISGSSSTDKSSWKYGLSG